jgi:hypothetical protein
LFFLLRSLICLTLSYSFLYGFGRFLAQTVDWLGFEKVLWESGRSGQWWMVGWVPSLLGPKPHYAIPLSTQHPLDPHQTQEQPNYQNQTLPLTKPNQQSILIICFLYSIPKAYILYLTEIRNNLSSSILYSYTISSYSLKTRVPRSAGKVIYYYMPCHMPICHTETHTHGG